MRLRSYYLRGKSRYKVRRMLAAKLVMLLAVVAMFIEPIIATQSDVTFRHRVKSEQEIAAEKKQREAEIIASLKVNDPLLYCFAKNESTFNPQAYNANDGGSPSYGLLQFKDQTFVEHCVFKYGMDYNGIWNIENQIKCARKMIDAGLIKRWGKRTLVNCKKFI
jgi:hypothetical protein